jgi:predicted ArsR family transcriptional regulator
MTMTTEEILLELEKAISKADSPDDAITTPELAELLSVGDAAVRRRLKRLSKSGRVVPVRVHRTDLAGCPRLVWAYKILPNPEKDPESGKK